MLRFLLNRIKNNRKEQAKITFALKPETEYKILSNAVSQLSEDVENLKKGQFALLTIIELEKSSEQSIYQEYKYKKWCEVPALLASYFKKRFHLQVIKSGDIGRPIGRYAILNENIGQTVERYYVFNQDGEAVTPSELQEEIQAATIGSEGV